MGIQNHNGVDMLAFFASLTVAAMSGLSILAVRYPLLYRKIYGKILTAGMILFFAYDIYYAGVVASKTALSSLIPMGQFSIAEQKINEITLNFGWALLVFIIFNGFVLFLAWLSIQVDVANLKQNKDAGD